MATSTARRFRSPPRPIRGFRRWLVRFQGGKFHRRLQKTAAGRFRRPRIALHVDQRLLGGIDRDPVEPGVELGLAAELVQRPVGPDEGFLRDVLDQVDIAHHAADQALDAALVLDDQQLEGLLVARDRALNQLKVDLARARRLGGHLGQAGVRRHWRRRIKRA
jgi:hypothetical protein